MATLLTFPHERVTQRSVSVNWGLICGLLLSLAMWFGIIEGAMYAWRHWL